MNKKILLFLILVTALFFRFYNLQTIPPGLYPDEAMNGNNAREAIRTLNFKVYYPENNGREGLFINIQALFLALISKNEPWVLRLPSAIFGFLTVLGIYFLILELFKNYKKEDDSKIKFNEKIALFGAFFLAVSFWHINFSRIGFRAIMAPFFLIWAMFFLFKSLNQSKKIYALISGIFFGLGFYTYIAYRVMPLLLLPIFVFYFKKFKTQNEIKNFYLIWVIFLIAAFFVALPIGLYYLKNPADFFGRTSQISIFSSGSPLKDLALNILKTLAMFNFVGDFNWRHNLAGRPELDILVGILFLLGIWLLIKERKDENIKFINYFLFLWFILAMLPVVISSEGLPHALRAILMLPPAIIFAGFGAAIFYEKILKNKKFANLVIFVLCLIIFLNAYYSYFILWAKNKNTFDAFSYDYVELGNVLNNLSESIPKYVIVKAQGVDVRGIPMPAQTTMFITNTFLPQNQKEKNIFYVLPEEEKNIPEGALVFEIK